jgi:hypothetical protein
MAKLLDRIHNYESMINISLDFKTKYFKEVQEYLIPMAKKMRREEVQYEQIITYLIK